MILCDKDCIPCCDFCVYATHETWVEDEKVITGGPIGCKKHEDQEHQDIADSCGYCDDFHCFNTKTKEKAD